MERKRFRLLIVVAIVAAIGVAVLLVLSYVPVPQTSNFKSALIHVPQTSCGGIQTPAGTNVSFSWSAPGTVYLVVLPCSQPDFGANDVAYGRVGTNGSGSYQSIGGQYEFGVLCVGPYLNCTPASISASFTAPLIAL